MGNIIGFARKRNVKPVMINNKKYVSAQEFCERVGVTIGTAYQWNSENKIDFKISYLGKVYYEEKAIDPFMRSLVKKHK